MHLVGLAGNNLVKVKFENSTRIVFAYDVILLLCKLVALFYDIL